MIASELFGQVDKIQDLVSQGVKYHKQGKYDEAVSKYKAALEIDPNSPLANYELAYTYVAKEQYDEAIKHGLIVIKQNAAHQLEAYALLGSCLNMTGKHLEAVKTFEEALVKFPNNNMLNYNLAVTCYNQSNYDKAEIAAINAIQANPNHRNSHMLLSAIMQEKGQRVQSILPLYYCLMLDPDSKIALENYNILRSQLKYGVEKKENDVIDVKVPITPSPTIAFDATNIFISMSEAARYSEEKKGKNDMELFAEMNEGIFSTLAKVKNKNTGFWWDFYVTKFDDLIQTNNCEAYSYFISQSTNNELVKKWINEHSAEMIQLLEWIKNTTGTINE